MASARRDIGEQTVVIRDEKVAFASLGTEMLGMDERAGYCYSLNGPAARVWELIETPRSATDICRQLCEEFAVDAQTCLRDVLEILASMREAGLVQVRDATALAR